MIVEIKIPNAFTPDGDVINDECQRAFPDGILDEVSNGELIIFNRWWQKVFSTNDLNIGWSGVQNYKRTSPDVWGIKADIATCDGRVVQFFKKGDVNSIR